MQPVEIIIGGARLDTWTEMTLQRKKEDLTGSLSVSIFAAAMPSGPLVRAAQAGAEINVYIAGQLAFCGTVDARTGTGAKKGTKKGGKKSGKDKAGGASGGKGGKESASSSVNIGPNEYTIKLTARGKTKRLIDSSHQHPTTNMLKPTTRQVVEELIKPWKIQLDWKGEVIKLDKVRFRDGARVVDELHRVGLENCYFMYESRDGKLVVTDGVGGQGGDALILGQNILTFSAEQSEDKKKDKIKVKGQRSKKEIWGRKSVRPTMKEIKVGGLQMNKPSKDICTVTVQHYGDADDKTLERRGRFEANKRNSESKKITIEVFHVQTPSGKPWDIGDTHYVEIPPEGIFDMFECTELTYHCDHEKTLKTTLILNPPPSGGAGGAGGGFGLSMLNMAIGAARRSQAGITMTAGQYPEPWGPPQIVELPFMTLVDALSKPPTEEEKRQEEEDRLRRPPPMVLPPWFGEQT
jgi:prophage tail gpP-like protein